MQGLMMEMPLLISSIIEHAAFSHAEQLVVSANLEGGIHRYTYADAHKRSKQLASALLDCGIEAGDRIATIALNTHRHFEVYFGVSGIGAVCHTINPRLHASQLEYVINHAEDLYLFVDAMFLPLLENLQDRIPHVRGVVVLTDPGHMPETGLENVLCYEDFIAPGSDALDWPTFDENTASSLCYTSGTTGHPKGVLYSHRSTVLHSYGISLPDVAQLGERECVLPVVPMFHVNAWGIPYAAPLTGSKLVLPGSVYDGPGLYRLLTDEGVTISGGVPTVWLELLEHLDESGERLTDLQRVIIGGAAAPGSMIREFQDVHSVEVRHAWGMTETSPVGTVSLLKPGMDGRSDPEREEVQRRQGRPVFGVELRIVDEQRSPLPHDGKVFGELEVRGPWVNRGYFGLDHSPTHGSDGWFATGDIATIDPDGYMRITDRSKDLIKSGGEWISSMDLENMIMDHPAVARAAVIGVADEKWGERPRAIVVRVKETSLSADDVVEHLRERVAKWSLPDEVIFVDALPLGATGKVLKSELRRAHGDPEVDDESAS
jgi:fatty-acyl-CoA synthase